MGEYLRCLEIRAEIEVAADRISKTTGYGSKALSAAIKSDKVAAKAAKARKKIANDKRYIAMMDRRMSSLSPEDYRSVQEYINKFM